MVISTLIFNLHNLNTDLLQRLIVVPQHNSTIQKNQNQLTVKEAIKLVKQAANTIESPPRIYASIGGVVGGNLMSWPDQPGSVTTAYNTCGAAPPPGISCQKPMQLKVLVTSNKFNNGYNITFLSTWDSDSRPYQHSWKFEINANRQVIFLGEEGDTLPPMPL